MALALFAYKNLAAGWLWRVAFRRAAPMIIARVEEGPMAFVFVDLALVIQPAPVALARRSRDRVTVP